METDAEAVLQPDATALTLRQRQVVWTCWLAGGLARLIYLFVIHPATHFAYSDMGGYIVRAMNFAKGTPEAIADTIYPPGASMLFGALYALDGSWALNVIVQWLLSLGIMGLIWLIARRFYGTSAAVVSLVIATLYFPFFHYAALFLSENSFTFLMLLSLWLLSTATASSKGAGVVAYGVAAGLVAGLAAAFKNTILGPLAITGLIYALVAIRNRRPHLLALSLGVAMGLACVLIPLSQRCTSLSEGRFCIAANNLAMNVLMGHYGNTREFVWYDHQQGVTLSFTAVESTLRGYTESARLDFGAYDSAANGALAKQWIAEHPWSALRLSLLNVWDLFTAPTLWPSARYRGVDFGFVSQCFFWLFILLPASLRLAARAGAMRRLQLDSLPEWLLVAPLLGLMASVFVSIAEVRFRVPFDGLLIVLAAPVYVSLGRQWINRRRAADIPRPAR